MPAKTTTSKEAASAQPLTAPSPGDIRSAYQIHTLVQMLYAQLAATHPWMMQAPPMGGWTVPQPFQGMEPYGFQTMPPMMGPGGPMVPPVMGMGGLMMPPVMGTGSVMMPPVMGPGCLMSMPPGMGMGSVMMPPVMGPGGPMMPPLDVGGAGPAGTGG